MTLTSLPRPVLTKQDFARRYYAGEFGNHSPTWDTLAEFLQEGYTGLCHLRNRVAGGVTHYKTPASEVAGLWRSKSNPASWYCSAQVPERVERGLRLQGEVMVTERGLYLYYTTVAKPMREALAIGAASTYGILASFLLRQHLCPNSYEWLMELLESYPSHVVEFSTYGTEWGTLYPKFNTVFWEVRMY